MKIQKVPISYATKYISVDGKEWDTERQCLQYEALLTDLSPLKNLSFYDSEGTPIDIFALKEIPPFVYLLVKEDSEVKYDPFVIKIILGAIGNYDASYTLPTRKGLWFNDWSNAYNGGYGFNGWELCESINSLQLQIASCQRKIELYKKISKGE